MENSNEDSTMMNSMQDIQDICSLPIPKGYMNTSMSWYSKHHNIHIRGMNHEICGDVMSMHNHNNHHLHNNNYWLHKYFHHRRHTHQNYYTLNYNHHLRNNTLQEYCCILQKVLMSCFQCN